MLAVVGDHLLGRPAGGFLGVDVFFVISGFLITGLLLREHDRTGRIDLLGFYKRRIKRTLPVAWVVLGVTVLVGSAVLSVYGFRQLVPAAVSAGTFWSNWHLIAIGTDYLHATDAPSAVQHYWSLAVEEQFYLVWPAVVIGSLWLGRHRGGRAVLGTVLGTAAAGTLVWSAIETAQHPTAAYFSTFSRGWELLAGAGLALAEPALRHLPSGLRPWLAWAGLAALVLGFVLVNADSAFPFPWALVAVLGAGLVIAAGAGGADTQVWPLTNGLAQWLGAISYSVYLWHFPVIVFVNALHPEAGIAVHALELALTVVLAALSFRLVEEPLRRARWRRPRFARPRKRVLLAFVAGTAACVLLAGASVVTRSVPVVVSAPTTGYFGEAQTPAGLARSAAIDRALGSTAWPALTPTDEQLGDGARVEEWTRDGCLNGFGLEETARRCVYGAKAAPQTAILYGDSVALSYLPALRRALAGRPWRIEVLTYGQCPAVAIPVALGDGSAYPDCDADHRFALARIEQRKPALVVMASSYLTIDRLAGGVSGDAAAAAWRTGAEQTVQRLSKAAGQVVVLDAPPIESSPQWCKTGLSSPRDCVTGVPGDWRQVTDAQHAGVSAAARPNVHYPSTLPWFCSAEGRCPSFVDGVVTLADGMHLTTAGSEQLAPLLRAVIDGAVVPTR